MKSKRNIVKRNARPDILKLFSREAPRRRISLKLIIILSIIFVLMIYTAFDTNRVAVQRQSIRIAAMPQQLDGYGILHLSDLHGRAFGENQEKLLKTIENLSYNIVLCTGDMIGEGDPQAFYDLIAGLKNNGKTVLYIPGDKDPDIYAENADTGSIYSEVTLEAQAHGATLVEGVLPLKYGNTTIWCIASWLLELDTQSAEESLQNAIALDAVKSDAASQQRAAVNARRLEVIKEFSSAVQFEMDENAMYIVLSHAPLNQDSITHMSQLSDTQRSTFLRRIHLILAGHYIGGQWRVPFAGALYIPDSTAPRRGWFPPDDTVQGIYTSNAITQFITPGLGVSGDYWLPPFRLFNTPRVSLLRLTN